MAGEVERVLSREGLADGVVRVGETVRRPLGAHGPAVHGLLRYLEDVGFDGAPRFLGVDEQGREVLSYVEGDVPRGALPGYAAADDALAGVARLLRRYHDAVQGYDPPAGARWDAEPADLDVEPELIGHCDITPENVVFRDGTPVALIDFDLARPTTRLYDVVTAVRHWAPLADPADRDRLLYHVDPGPRVRLFCDAYGLARDERRWLLPAAWARFERSYRVMRERAERRGGVWAALWDGGAGRRIRRAQDWMELHWDDLDGHLV